jgi:hypothetical protein
VKRDIARPSDIAFAAILHEHLHRTAGNGTAAKSTVLYCVALEVTSEVNEAVTAATRSVSSRRCSGLQGPARGRRNTMKLLQRCDAVASLCSFNTGKAWK